MLAVRSGVVAAAVTHFSGGGAKAHLAPRANFVAVRHSDGTYARYYHLRTAGSLLKVGDTVEAGQHIAWSGNTGYTGGPHLHLDVVNLLPEETSRLRVVEPKSLARLIPSVAAAFSCLLPRDGAPACVLRYESAASCAQGATYAAAAGGGPPSADEPQKFANAADGKSPLNAGTTKRTKLRPDAYFIALADRDPAASFAQKVDQLAKRGACAAIIANNRSGPEVFAMGGCEKPSAIPCVLVSKEHGAWLKQALSDHNSRVFVSLGAHPAVRGVATLEDQIADLRHRGPAHLADAETPLSFKYGPRLQYVTRTLPVEFLANYGMPFVPMQGVLYPRPSVSCRPCCMHPKRQKGRGGAGTLALNAHHGHSGGASSKALKPTSARTRDSDRTSDLHFHSTSASRLHVHVCPCCGV